MSNESERDEAITVKGLWVSYGSQVVLKDINLTVYERDFVGIIGPNGGGKTTLLKTMVGLIKPSKGTIRLHGREVKDSSGSIGYVPQRKDIPQDFPITVFDVVRMGRYSRRGLGRHYSADDDEATLEALRSVNMEDLKDKEISKLSGGQQQRAFIARALVNDPDLLLLDEPNIGIDVTVQEEFYSLLKRLNEKMTIIMISHDVTAISTYVKSIACLNKELHYHGTKEIKREDFEKVYHCPVEMIAHGMPHRVLEEHR